MAYNIHVIKGIPVTSTASKHNTFQMMKPRRKVMLLVVFVAVVTIVMLTSIVSDATFGQTWSKSIQTQSQKLIHTVVFPINSVKKTNTSISNLKNATISGHEAIGTNKVRKVSNYSMYKIQGDVSMKSEGFKDPLVIETRIDTALPSVPLLAPLNQPGAWNGRNLIKAGDGSTTMLQDEQYFHLQHGIQSGGLNISHLAEYSLAEKMLPWEWDMYKDLPVVDMTEMGSELFSKAFLVFPRNNSHLKVGDSISVRVDVYDGLGRVKRRGGDEIRVWLREESINAGAGLQVTDLRNGSYLATGTLLWSGRPEIRANLVYPREIIRAVYYLRNVMKGLRLNAGGFVSPIASEATVCSPFPFSGIYRHLCNLTSLNYGLSWYCGMPANPALSCKHWKQIRDLDFPNPLPLNVEVAKWMKDLATGKKHYLRLIKNYVIPLEVSTSIVPVIEASLPCNKRPLVATWKDRAPRGFILRDQWLPLACSLPSIDHNYVNQCLKGSTLYMIGDSNLRHMLEMMARIELCIPTQPLLGKRNWHSPQTCVNHKFYYAVKWRTHAQPFHTNNDHWAPRTNQQAVGLSLDAIPSTGRYIVLLHMYLHFTTHHYSVYRDRIRSMKDAVARLLKRNPTTKVVIRGPHVAYAGWAPTLGGDVQAPRFIDILKEEFKSLYHQVLLLDFWDFSIAAESRDFHPEGKVTQEMLRTIFGYVCE